MQEPRGDKIQLQAPCYINQQKAASDDQLGMLVHIVGMQSSWNFSPTINFINSMFL